MGNDMWQVALVPGTSRMQDIVLANLEISDLDTIFALLGTSRAKGKFIENERGNYLLMYGGEYERPYPSVMIWRYIVRGEEQIIQDMRVEDSWIVEYVWREWLMPADTEEEFIPPKAFIVMSARKG